MDIYELLMDEGDGITYVSLVSDPAVVIGWQTYSNEDFHDTMQFKIDDESERVITGCLMLADTLIYRRNGDYEYQVFYSKDTIKKMGKELLRTHNFNNVDTEHNNKLVDGVELIEIFIKDTQKGITPNGFEKVADGSLFVSYHVTSDEVWNDIVEGRFTGYSLKGFFNLSKTDEQIGRTVEELYNNNMIEKFKETLKRILASFGRIETKEGVIAYNEEELSKGVEVYNPETGEPTSDGEYHTETSVIVITDGKVADIIEENEEEPAQEEEETVKEEPVEEEETVAEESETDGDIEGIKSEIETIKSEIETIKGEIAEIKSLIEGLKETEKEPIEVEFEKNRKKFSSIDGSKLVETLKNIKKTTNNKY